MKTLVQNYQVPGLAVLSQSMIVLWKLGVDFPPVPVITLDEPVCFGGLLHCDTGLKGSDAPRHMAFVKFTAPFVAGGSSS